MIARSLLLCFLMAILAVAPAALPQAPHAEDFTLMWWAEGPPYYYTMKAPPPRPLLVLASGTLGLVLDTQSLEIQRAGRFAKAQRREQDLTAWRKALATLPPLPIALEVVQDGKRYRCTGRGPAPKDEFFQPVRFIESGLHLQRLATEGLEFQAPDGARWPARGRVEIAFWPDRLNLRLFMDDTDKSEATLCATLPGLPAATGPLAAGGIDVPLIRPSSGTPPSAVTVQAAEGLAVTWVAGIGCYEVRLPEAPWSNAKGTYYPEEHLDRLDRWPITLRNDSASTVKIPLMFVQERHLPITGFTPLLCDPEGAPTGLPVQISKNWHQRPEKGHLPHEGPWFHGCAFVRLPPRATREFRFTMAYARWGRLPAASHAQLSLIGWGHNLFWDESALGSFGESICYEPGRVQRRCFIDDFRPLLTRGAPDAKPFGWSANAGGGDFLLWIDETGRDRGFRGTRTEYRAYGPCLTDVVYREETTGGEIAARMAVSLARSDDCVRLFHHLRYDVRQPVRWQRLAFQQLGADYYNDVPARTIALGDAAGVRDEWQPKPASGTYDRQGLPLTGPAPWISAHGIERAALPQGIAAASRGLIVRSWKAVLGGKNVPTPHASFYANEWHPGYHRTAIEIGPPPGLSALRPGDYVEALIEWVVFPADPAASDAPNPAFRAALMRDADTWRLVQREAAGNNLTITMRQGRLRQRYPVAVQVDRRQCADFELTGGLGAVPLTFTGLDAARAYELRTNGEIVDQSVHGNDFWQTDYDLADRSWRLTYNLPRDQSGPARITFRKARK